MNPPPLPVTPSEVVVPPYYPPQHGLSSQNPIPQYPPSFTPQQPRPSYQYPQIPAQSTTSQHQQHPPRLQVQTQSVHPASVPVSVTPRQRLVPRSDVQYDPRTNVLTACLEMPGVRKADLRVTLSTCLFNRIRQVVIQGFSNPVFAPVNGPSQGFPSAQQSASASGTHTSAMPAGVGFGVGSRPGGVRAHIEREAPNFSIRERKYGEFSRTFPVPSDTKPEDIQVVMEDGILTIRIACGIPALDEDAYDIPIR
ncbi:hypothetical protein K435DRAFT_333040 [Dendrothele bispora CBS 962.96]|uniref:SHSP domain-containing protein n=1 Tax=Dendrothele bispora (strain CBS 962.96) TaxID=1314807 RepID=A0A4S8MXH0_DENBC|nr:hypothetical protein K435DRAFT_333040 [Dendrothele bispora CBS 962.96]